VEQSKRQLQIAKIIQKELTDIFTKNGLNIFKNGMISIPEVVVTPDLYEARVYLSFFNIEEDDALLESINNRVGEWRGLLGNRVRNQLRRVPTLVFYKDETLEQVYKMEELFKKIEQEREARPPSKEEENNNTEA
jgi:ribosome-binding factor A